MKGLTPIILILLAISMFYFYVDPQYIKIQESLLLKEKYENALAAAGELEIKQNELIDQYNMFSDDELAKLEALLPRKIEEARVLFDVDTIAQRHDIDISGVETADKNRSAPGRSRVEENRSSHESLQVAFTFESTYANFVNFLKDLEKSLRIVDVVGIEANSETEAGAGRYEYTVTIETYWLK